MKKSYSVIMLAAAMTLSAEGIYAKPQSDTTKNGPDSLPAAHAKPEHEQEGADESKKADKESTFDLGMLLGIVGCVGLLVSISSLALSFLVKKKSEQRLDDLDDYVRRMRTDFFERMTEVKEFARRQDSEMIRELQEELRQKKEETKEPLPAECSQKEETDTAEQEFKTKTYYASYQSGDGYFDAADFRDMPGPALPFKVIQTSPTEAEIEVVTGYDASLNTQVKDVCNAMSGNWTTFTALAVRNRGLIKRDSDKDSCWTLVKKIDVSLS